jgi:choline dehydrogenase-like flavoprotein
VLEQGQLQTEQDFDGRELNGFATLFLDRGIASTEDRAIALLAGRTVGGGTVVNWSTSLRLPEVVRDEWHRHGIEDLDDHFASVETRLHIDTEESGRNGPNTRLEDGLRQLQLPCRTIPRNVHGCGDCGTCGFGCRRAAKQSALRTYLVDACNAGVAILAGCEARRVDVERGQVRGVTARVGGSEVTIRTPLVALAGGAVGSPALLLRSGIAGGQAGRNLHLHPTTAIFGVYDAPTPAWRGVPQAVVGEGFADLVAGYGFRLECPPALPGILASSLSWWGAAEHRAQMAEASHTAPFIAIVRDRDSGRVDLDRSGEARIRYRVGSLERQHLMRAMIEGARVQLAAGARRVGTLHTPPLILERGRPFDPFAAAVQQRGTAPNRVLLFSAHQMSSCRIGTRARESVARPDGQVWEVRGLYVTDASAFPTASGVNPMLTTMALACRTAAGMVR